MERKTCPRCSTRIEDGHPYSICAACLLREGLSASNDSPLQCAACHGELTDDARFCPGCGARVPDVVLADEDPIRRALQEKLQGQYRVVRLLGRGGMGAVYLARDLTLDREVAIKVVGDSASDRETVERFRREARTAAGLSHPNIVPLHAFGEVEGMPYFVMGYVRGESLAARLRREGRLPEEEARRILIDVASALDHAHRQGIIHRDVKPDNVLIDDESGRALLTDFGVARTISGGAPLTRTGSIVGTPQFMSPEQAGGEPLVDGRSDLYSFGVMGYAMLTGRLPFDGATPREILTKHLTQEPPAIRSVAPSVSDVTAQAIERCLAKDPEHRWPDARALELALGASEVDQLPDSLEAVDGSGVLYVLLATLMALFLLYIPEPEAALLSWRTTALILGGIAAAAYVSMLVKNRREGFSFRESQRALWREPAWWTMWYPRPLRRAGNIWDSLPAPLRHARGMQLVVLTLLPLILLLGKLAPGMLLRLRNVKYYPEDGTMDLGYVHVGATVFAYAMIIFIALMIRAHLHLKRKGLSPGSIGRVLFSAPTSHARFWARPHIAPLLVPPSDLEPPRRSDSPHDHLQAILRDARELTGPLRALGARAAAAGRQLVESIENADRNITNLMRNVEPGEEERLLEKIDALANSPEEDDDSPKLRSLLEKQLELIRGLAARIDETNEHRNRQMQMLKTLALHLASLRANTESVAGVHPLSDRVRAICDEISLHTVPKPHPGEGATGDMPTERKESV